VTYEAKKLASGAQAGPSAASASTSPTGRHISPLRVELQIGDDALLVVALVK
jgi:hypothetical protein